MPDSNGPVAPPRVWPQTWALRSRRNSTSQTASTATAALRRCYRAAHSQRLPTEALAAHVSPGPATHAHTSPLAHDEGRAWQLVAAARFTHIAVDESGHAHELAATREGSCALSSEQKPSAQASPFLQGRVLVIHRQRAAVSLLHAWASACDSQTEAAQVGPAAEAASRTAASQRVMERV